MRKILSLLLFCAVLISCRQVKSTSGVTITNDPYEAVDWDSVFRLKSSLHVHTVNSTIEHGVEEGTTVTPAEQIARYEELGYDVLAITDHDYVTYPWSEYGKEDSPMISIKGNEFSKNDNFCAYFCDWLDLPGQGPEKTVGFEESIKQVSAEGGIIYLAHPMRSGDIKNAEFSAMIFRAYPQVYGMEVLNVGQFERNNSSFIDRAQSRYIRCCSALSAASPVQPFFSRCGQSVGKYIKFARLLRIVASKSALSEALSHLKSAV